MRYFLKILELMKEEENKKRLTPHYAYEAQKKWMTQAMFFFLFVTAAVLVWSWLR